MSSQTMMRLVLGLGCLWPWGTVPAGAQEIVRSVVVTVDGAGRLAPVPPGARPAGAKRYWADTPTQSIRRSNLDGSGVEEVLSGLSGPYGLSFDAEAGTLLWTSAGNETVEALDPRGTSKPRLETEFEEPYAIVHEIEGGLLAYAVVDGQVVRILQRADRDTEQVDVLMGVPGGGAEEPLHGLALDAIQGVLYVGNGDGMMSHRIRLSDGRVTPLVFVDEAFATGGGGFEEVIR